MCICIKDICYNIYYCLYECFYPSSTIKSIRQVLFIDEERGFIYYNQLPTTYDYNNNNNNNNESTRNNSVEF